MRQRNAIQLALLASTTTTNAFECSPSAFEAILPSGATVAYTQSLTANSTFEVPPGDIAYPTSPQGLPALCAIQVNASSSPTSTFSFGLFLPQEWNSRFLAVGNGGFAGGINWLDMAAGVEYGFATMSTDTGHNSTSSDISWALNNIEAKVDFGWRAMHESIVLAKSIAETYYEEQLQYSYYSGCSTGGRQGLKEVQMFPDDFDGVLAGAPAWWTTHLQTASVKIGLYNLPVTADYHIPPSMFSAIEKEVLRQCDPQDGLKDNIIMNPTRCDFFPEALLCASGVTNDTTAGCLTSAQIGTLYNIYNDYVDVNQTFVFPHLQLGSEFEWDVLLGATTPSPLGYEYPQYMLDLGANWSFYNFDYGIVQLADAEDPGSCNADDFDLSPFEAKGGKLITYQGHADAFIPTGSSVYFYKSVLKTLQPKGIELDPFYRHFLVPGMGHCAGTPDSVNAPWYFAGPNQAGALSTRPGSVHGVPGFEDAEHDILLALMEWTEKGTAPERIVATKWRNDTLVDEVWRQRPICVFPRVARYLGGDEDAAGSWRCGFSWEEGEGEL